MQQIENVEEKVNKIHEKFVYCFWHILFGYKFVSIGKQRTTYIQFDLERLLLALFSVQLKTVGILLCFKRTSSLILFPYVFFFSFQFYNYNNSYFLLFVVVVGCRCLPNSIALLWFALQCCSMHSHIHSFTCIFSLVFILFYFSLGNNPHSAYIHTDIHKCRLLHRLIDPKSHESKLENLKCHRQRRHTKFETWNNFFFSFFLLRFHGLKFWIRNDKFWFNFLPFLVHCLYRRPSFND